MHTLVTFASMKQLQFHYACCMPAVATAIQPWRLQRPRVGCSRSRLSIVPGLFCSTAARLHAWNVMQLSQQRDRAINPARLDAHITRKECAGSDMHASAGALLFSGIRRPSESQHDSLAADITHKAAVRAYDVSACQLCRSASMWSHHHLRCCDAKHTPRRPTPHTELHQG
jgi:hypothetical protein